MDFVEVQMQRYPELCASYEEMGTLFSRKLWHELTDVLENFLKDNSNKREDNFYELYTEFISKFENRLSPIRFAYLVGLIGASFEDAAREVPFYSSILTSAKTKLSREAAICVSMDIVAANVRLGKKDAALNMLTENWEKLSGAAASESMVYSKYYFAAASYRKVFGPPLDFYRAVLMFLAYTPLEKIPPEVQYTLATDFCLAAVTSEEIFNFGEVVSAPVLQAIRGTPNQWLFELVHALNDGNMAAFDDIATRRHSAEFNAHPSLVSGVEVIRQKVTLLSVMNLAFKRHPHDRCIAFADIAAAASIPLDRVEWVLMRALALNLIKGTMDEIAQTIQVTWVMPRVLNKEHIALVAGQLEGWMARVKSTLTTVEDQAAEL